MLTESVTDSQSYPNIAIDLKDNIHVAWHSMPLPTQIKYMKWDAETKSWGSEEYVAMNPYNNTNPSIGVDYRGYVYVAWVFSLSVQIVDFFKDAAFAVPALQRGAPRKFVRDEFRRLFVGEAYVVVAD